MQKGVFDPKPVSCAFCGFFLFCSPKSPFFKILLFFFLVFFFLFSFCLPSQNSIFAFHFLHRPLLRKHYCFLFCSFVLCCFPFLSYLLLLSFQPISLTSHFQTQVAFIFGCLVLLFLFWLFVFLFYVLLLFVFFVGICVVAVVCCCLLLLSVVVVVCCCCLLLFSVVVSVVVSVVLLSDYKTALFSLQFWWHFAVMLVQNMYSDSVFGSCFFLCCWFLVPWNWNVFCVVFLSKEAQLTLCLFWIFFSCSSLYSLHFRFC